MSSSVGRLALGIVGAVIGTAFSAPGIGFSIGSTIGGLLFPPEGATVEGPRVGDADITASTLGKIIPYHYGVTRAAGNVFWSAGLKETKVEEEVGGKGGPTQTNISYKYTASFATAFGGSPAVDVLRIWADGKIIYDASGAGTQARESTAPKFNFRFVRGGDLTSVDPLIAESINRRLAGMPDINEGNGPQATFKTIDDLIAEAGASGDPRSDIYATYLTQLKTNAEAAGGMPPDYGFTPTYKEFCYIVFDDMPLEDFGNRIPNVTAEIVWTNNAAFNPNDTISQGTLTEISADTSAPISGMGVDPLSRTILVRNATKIRKFSAGAQAEVMEADATQSTATLTLTLTTTVDDILCADAHGDFIVRLSRSGDTMAPIIGKVKNQSLEVFGDVDDTGTPRTMGAGPASITYATKAGQNGSRSLVAGVSPSGDLYVFQVFSDRVEVVWGETGATFAGIGPGPMTYAFGSSGDSTIYWIGDDGTNWTLYEVHMLFGPTGTITVNTKTLATGTVATEDPRAVIYDVSTHMLYGIFASAGGGGSIAQYDPRADGTATDPYQQYSQPLTLTPPAKTSGLTRSFIVSNKIGYASGTDACIVSTVDGTELIYPGSLTGVASDVTQVYIGNFGALYTWIGNTPSTVQYARLSSSMYSTDLGSVIASICERSGMTPDEYDVSDVAGEYEVIGFTVARPSSGRKTLEHLLLPYFVDGVETDWKVQFKRRSDAPVRTIKESELGSVKGPTGDVSLLETRQPEYNLPAEIAMIYVDQDRDYQQGSAHYRRVADPAPVMYSKKTQTVELPLVLRSAQARSVAQRMLFTTWMARDTTKFRVPWTHADLDPADVVKIEMDDGRTITDRVGKLAMGANFEMDIESTRHSDPTFSGSAMSPLSSSGVPYVGIVSPVYAKLLVLDMPLIHDYHDTARTSSRYYTAVGSDTTSFLSASLYKSVDGSVFAGFDVIDVDVTWGQVVGSGLQPPRALWTMDRDNTITVSLTVDNGDVNSVTYDQILNQDANMALIWNETTGVGEIIQFQDVTVNSDGTVTLSNLVRGRRGTDYAVNSHTQGEIFILLKDASVIPQVQPIAAIGTQQYFKAVSRGASIGAAQPVPVTFKSRDLMPYAPNNVRRSDDGTDLTVKWTRRTRIGGEWNMTGTGVETVPLNEDFEKYEMYILENTADPFSSFDPNNATTYKEMREVATPEDTFTASELTTLGYTLSDTFNCVIYQISAQVGRGFPREAALFP